MALVTSSSSDLPDTWRLMQKLSNLTLMRIRLLCLVTTSSLLGLKRNLRDCTVLRPQQSMSRPLLCLRLTHGLLLIGMKQVWFSLFKTRDTVAHAGLLPLLLLWSLPMLSPLADLILKLQNNSLWIVLLAMVIMLATVDQMKPLTLMHHKT